MTIRTRFAPSPTGYLHIGGARTALFSWLHAQKHHGSFILRIEDTDRERSTQASVDAILEGMAWLGLPYQEGPIYQTHRFPRYAAVAQQLLASGHAYYCYMSQAELDQLRDEQEQRGEKRRYDGRYRDYQGPPLPGISPVIRFKNPQHGSVVFDDLVRGKISVQNQELDDLVIVRADGTPTYNFAVVVDDWDMGITQVIRGDDHINNTPRQLNLFQALGATPPQYAHVPMILGEDGQRLSKRHGAVSVMQYRDMGYLPEALLNYLVRLGWSHGDQEIFSRAEMIEYFEIADVNKAAAAFNPEKLLWLNQHYLKTLPPAQVAPHLLWHFQQQGLNPANGPDLVELVTVQAERVKTLAELVAVSRYFYEEISHYDEKAAQKHLRPAILQPLQSVRDRWAALTQWTPAAIHETLQATLDEYHLGFGKLAQPLRVALTGNASSPSIDATAYLLGQARTLARLQRASDWLSQQSAHE